MTAEVCEVLGLQCPRIPLSVSSCLTCTHAEAFCRHILVLRRWLFTPSPTPSVYILSY